MSLEFPIQNRAIDPYSSYNSNVVNVLTRMITRGKNCLHGVHAIDVVIDSTCGLNEIAILPGECFKDDVLIQILETKYVDMTIADYYINHMNPWTEAGYYYVCLEYVYQKAKPAPEAKIRILKPSQTSLYDPDNSPFLLLKVVNVTFDGTTFQIDSLHNSDPSNTDNKREYSQLYAGVEDTLPVFERNRDEGRIIYVHDKDELFFGIENTWESFNGVRANIDTSLCTEGDVVYINSNCIVEKAISNDPNKLADGIVIQTGTTDGKIRLFGEFKGVKIESGVTVAIGDNLYLSSHEAGTLTNLKPYNYAQYIGVATTNSNLNKCDILFLPNRNIGQYPFNSVFDFYQDLLHSSIFEYLVVDTFENNDFIDSTSSNVNINVVDYSITGGTGDVYQSISLQESSYASRIQLAQITAKSLCTNPSSKIKWYISNNGSEPLDWEKAELDKLHYFSTYRLEFSSVSGVFEVDENVLSATTNKMATINGINSGQILVFGDTRDGIDYIVGETITGQTSGATGIISNIVNRETSSYHDLRIKIEFEGTSGDCFVYNYGILYDQDEDIFNTFPSEVDIQANIDTLYLDLYTYPSQDNDGNANLATPIQTQINDLRLFIDSTCCDRLDYLETEYIDLRHDVDNFVSDSTSIDQLIQQVSIINNDIDTLYSDIYHTPHRDNDGNPNRSEPIEDTLDDLQTQINGLSGSVVRPAMFVTTADTSPDVANVPSIIRFDYSSALTVNNFDNPTIGQEIVLVFTNDQITIENNSNIILFNGIDFQSQNNWVLSLVYNGTAWIEKSRNTIVYS